MADGAWMALDENGHAALESPSFHAAGMRRLMPEGHVEALDLAGDDEMEGLVS